MAAVEPFLRAPTENQTIPREGETPAPEPGAAPGAPPEQERNRARLLGDERKIANRMTLEGRFREAAQTLLEQKGLKMDEPEDVRRVSTIFVGDDWNNRKLSSRESLTISAIRIPCRLASFSKNGTTSSPPPFL